MVKTIQKLTLIGMLVLASSASNAANWKTKTFKDEMSGVTRIEKSLVAVEGDVTLFIQVSGYGKNDNIIWGRSKNMLDLHWKHENLRIKIDGKLYRFGTSPTGKDYREFIFGYACLAAPGPDFECAREDASDYLIKDEQLVNLLVQAKEIKLELPFYRKGNLIKTFR